MLHADNRPEIYAELIRDKPVNNKTKLRIAKKKIFFFLSYLETQYFKSNNSDKISI